MAAFLRERHWKRGALWLCFLAPFFFLTYGFANSYTASLPFVGSVVFGWERHIPFIPWMILPYWSIDLLYGLSLFLWTSRRDLDRHALRLVAASTLCVAGFLLFPLRFSFERPDVAQSFFRLLFDMLESFDQPYNQAPSLHICLLIILWDAYARCLPARLRPLVHLWAIVIGVSVFTTYQHHIIDGVAAVPVALLCCYLFPLGRCAKRPVPRPLEGALDPGGNAFGEEPCEKPVPGPGTAGASSGESGAAATQCRFAFLIRPSWCSAQPGRAHRLGRRYAGIGTALVCAGLAAASIFSVWWLLLVWPGLCFAVVGMGYLGLGPSVFQKIGGTGPEAGKRPWASRMVLAPYEYAARLFRRKYLAVLPAAAECVPGLWLGAYPTALPAPGCGVLDLTSEYLRPAVVGENAYGAVPLLDLLPPNAEELTHALECLAELQQRGPVLVHCALGMTRSALVVACAMVLQGHYADVAAALERITAVRPIAVSPEAAAAAEAAVLLHKSAIASGGQGIE